MLLTKTFEGTSSAAIAPRVKRDGGVWGLSAHLIPYRATLKGTA